ncbi:MAG: domain/sensory box/EAL domain protein [Chitinophagaceae bacterium]|nr:domain/sensory box/EAL domain protein [Chitinophagaceae bacterium]
MENIYKIVLEDALGSYWDHDVKKNSTYLSPRFHELLGYEEHELVFDRDWLKRLVFEEDAIASNQKFNEHITSKGTIPYRVQIRYIHKNGDTVWLQSTGRIIEWDEKKNPLRIVGCHIDITKQKEIEEELNQTLNIISEQNNRLLNFAYIVSHNLRSHSSNFKLLLDVMGVSETEEEQTEAIEHLKDIYLSLDDTIKNLNAIVNIQTNISKQKEELNLYAYIEKTTDLLRSEIKLKQAVIHNTVPRDIVIHYNPAYIESILLNLITNAIKYCHPDRTPEIHLSTRYENDRLLLEVTDNGLGIDLEKHGKKYLACIKHFMEILTPTE